MTTGKGQTLKRDFFDWTPARVEYLTKWWGKFSASQIAEKLGCTRNAAIGKSHRLGLPNLGNPIGRRNAEIQPTEREAYERRDADGKPKVTGIPRGGHRSGKRSKPSATSVITTIVGGDPARASIAGSQAWSLKSRTVHGDPVRNGIRSGQAAAERRLSVGLPARRIETHEPKQAEPIIDNGKRGVALADLAANGCKWAVTPHHVRPDGHRFCNAPRLPERPWCAEHAEKAKGRERVSSEESLEHLSGVDAPKVAA